MTALDLYILLLAVICFIHTIWLILLDRKITSWEREIHQWKKR